VERLVARATARHQPDLALHRRVAAEDDPVLVVDPQLGVGGRHAAQRLRDDVCGVVDDLLHELLLGRSPSGGAVRRPADGT
jgi:hypothetical protein